MSEPTQTSKWTIVTRVAGLVIVAAVLVLLLFSAFTGQRYDAVAVEMLLVIAAWLLGGSALFGFWKRRNGNGSG